MPMREAVREDEAAIATTHLNKWIVAQGCLDADENDKKCGRGRDRLFALFDYSNSANS